MAKNKKLHAKRWMSYSAAKQTIQDIGTLTSRQKYWNWWDKVEPLALPKYPNRVYPEWTTWGDYLGVHNSFDAEDRSNFDKANARQYWDAVRWVQKQKYSSREVYWQAYDDDVPKTIPKHPDTFYPNFWKDGGWTTFLGKKLDRQVLSAKEVVGIYCLFQSSYQPPNVFEIIAFPEGVDQLRKFMDNRSDLKVFKAYVWEREQMDQVDRILNVYASPQDRNVWLVPNVHALLFELDNVLMMYRPGH